MCLHLVSYLAPAMIHVRLKCLLFLYLADVVVSDPSPEPEPSPESVASMSTTLNEDSAPAPAPSPASASESTTSTTTENTLTTTEQISTTTGQMTSTTKQQVVHTITLVVSLSNISAITDEAALMQQLASGIRNAAGGSGNITVTVVLHFINVDTLYGGLPQIVIDDIVAAYAAMVSVNASTVSVKITVSSGSGRRLSSYAAPIQTRVLNTPSVDCVNEAQRIMSSDNASVFGTHLRAQNETAYANTTSIVLVNPPVASFSASTQVTGTNTSPNVANIQNHVASNIAGGGTVSAAVTSVGLPACDYSEQGCLNAVIEQGLSPGGNGWPFAGDYSETGCYAYVQSDVDFPGMAFYGYVGIDSEVTSEDQLSVVLSPKYRICGVAGDESTTTLTTQGAPAPPPAPTTTTSSNQLENNHQGPMASLMSMWAVVYAFMLS